MVIALYLALYRRIGNIVGVVLPRLLQHEGVPPSQVSPKRHELARAVHPLRRLESMAYRWHPDRLVGFRNDTGNIFVFWLTMTKDSQPLALSKQYRRLTILVAVC